MCVYCVDDVTEDTSSEDVLFGHPDKVKSSHAVGMG